MAEQNSMVCKIVSYDVKYMLFVVNKLKQVQPPVWSFSVMDFGNGAKSVLKMLTTSCWEKEGELEWTH